MVNKKIAKIKELLRKQLDNGIAAAAAGNRLDRLRAGFSIERNLEALHWECVKQREAKSA